MLHTGGPKTEIKASQSRPALSLFSRALEWRNNESKRKSKAGLALAWDKIKTHLVLKENKLSPGSTVTVE
jgi:hypothetical protein